MDEEAFRAILKAELATVKTELTTVKTELTTVKTELTTVKTELTAVKTELTAMKTELEQRITGEIAASERRLRAEIEASEQRRTENGRLQFRQLGDLYRATNEKIERLDAHLSDRIDQTRGAIEALRSSLEHQDFRSDELARRVTALETRPIE